MSTRRAVRSARASRSGRPACRCRCLQPGRARRAGRGSTSRLPRRRSANRRTHQRRAPPGSISAIAVYICSPRRVRWYWRAGAPTVGTRGFHHRNVFRKKSCVAAASSLRLSARSVAVLGVGTTLRNSCTSVLCPHFQAFFFGRRPSAIDTPTSRITEGYERTRPAHARGGTAVTSRVAAKLRRRPQSGGRRCGARGGDVLGGSTHGRMLVVGRYALATVFPRRNAVPLRPDPHVIALPDDFRDILVELHDAGAAFVVVGGYAVAFHGHPRAT